MVRPDDPELKRLLQQFVCVKRTSLHDVNLRVFDFDYDLTWWAFLIDANERVYSRFGGSGDGDPASRLSVAGLKYTLRLVLNEHKRHGNDPAPDPVAAVRPVDLFGMKGKCMHCHQVNERFYKRDKARATQWDKLRFLPLPENLGLTLSIDAGNRVSQVAADSPADQAGIRPGDVLQRIENVAILSQGDAMWALKSAPMDGRLRVSLVREGSPREAVVALSPGWKAVDLSWRRSLAKLKP